MRASISVVRRRLCFGAAIGWAARANAQLAPRTPHIALVFNISRLADMQGSEPADPYVRAFLQGLGELGYVDGRNIVVKRQSAEGDPERMPRLMHDLVAQQIDIIVTSGRGCREARNATESIPIVGVTERSVELGLARTLAQPGYNYTGLDIGAGPTMLPKRLSLLKEAAPRVSRVAFLGHLKSFYFMPESTAAAAAMGLTLLHAGADTEQELDSAFAAITRQSAGGLVVDATPVNMSANKRIIEFALKQRLPAIYGVRLFTLAGGLMSYGANLLPFWRRAPVYVDKILRGARPGDLPIEQATHFDFVINRKAARQIGLTLPQALLLQANELIG